MPFLSRPLCLLLLGSMPAGAAVAGDFPAAEPPRTITTIAEAFARWPEATADDQPIRIEGVVTGTMPSGAFRLHDGDLGIYVTKSTEGQALAAGDRVRVVGVLRHGGFSPWMSPHEVIALGRGELPQARPVNYAVLASGVADNQWVEIDGVVRSAHVRETHDFAVLELGMSGGNLRVFVTYEDGVDFASLVDAGVRLRGVAAVNVNAQRHVVEPSFRVPSVSEITVLKPAPPDVFARPRVPVPQLMRAAMGRDHGHRVRAGGVVTRRLSDTVLFLRDGAAGLKVETSAPMALQPGDRIEAAGFPVMADGMAVLQQSVCRVVRQEQPPIPARPTLSALIEGTHHSDLVSLEARLVDWTIAGRNATLIFQAGDQMFKGLLNLPAELHSALPEKNSLVEVTGVCVISELEDIWFYQPRSFLLLVADLGDLRVIQSPPWWTPERLWRALAITGLVLIGGIGWVWSLRRQIEIKRALIEQQASHAAVLEERSRIARELHDTLEQGLTGLSLQMKAMETDLVREPHPISSRLQFARQMLRRSRALARNAIRELRAEAVPARPQGLVEGLKYVAESWNHAGALKVQLEISGAARPLPPTLEHNLLGIGTEAMTNAVKHAGAEAMRVVVDFGPQEIAIRVADNGVGFDPAARIAGASGSFGLLGMHERARDIGGRLDITSEPGRGTEVRVAAPLPPASETDLSGLDPILSAAVFPARSSLS